MSKTLVVLTDQYPYGDGETFIENERMQWRQFERVYICPVLISDQSVIRSGFCCHSNEILISEVKSRNVIADYFLAFFGSLGLKQIVTEIKDGKVLKQNPSEILRRLVVMERERNRVNLRVNKLYKKLIHLLKPKDEVYLYSYWMYEPAMVGIELKKNFHVKSLISRAHGYDLYEYRHKNEYIPFRKYALDRIDRICPISKDGAKYLHQKYVGKYDDKVTVERLGTIRLFEGPVMKEQPDHPVIVSCSNMIPLKRLDLIIKALSKSQEKIEWHHFGDGFLSNYLSQEAEKLPKNITTFFHGRVANYEVQRFYYENSITAFINTSVTEGVPVSIMEAQSYGIPVIATNVGGTSEILSDGVNGILLKPDFKDEELLNAIMFIFNNQKKYQINSQEIWSQLSDANSNYDLFFEREFRK